MAKVNAAMKDVLEEYTKWRADNDEALGESQWFLGEVGSDSRGCLARWFSSGEQNEGPDC